MVEAQRWVSATRIGDLPSGTVKTVWIQDRSVALVNLGGTLYAVGGVCPHRDGPLGEGRLVHSELACPWHGFRYDLRTGRATVPAVHPGVPTFAVRVVGDEVQVALSPGKEVPLA
jgi:nitrite reductase/ring-hydroxylating ferredoxin subunit